MTVEFEKQLIVKCNLCGKKVLSAPGENIDYGNFRAICQRCDGGIPAVNGVYVAAQKRKIINNNVASCPDGHKPVHIEKKCAMCDSYCGVDGEYVLCGKVTYPTVVVKIDKKLKLGDGGFPGSP